MEIKQALAEEAVRIVSGARRAAYGRPEQNFERIARLWNAHMLNTGREGNLTAVDVATFCRLIKEARLAETPDHRDSFVDILGYTLCQAEIALPPMTLCEAVCAALVSVEGPPLAPEQQDAISQSWADAANADREPVWKQVQLGDIILARLRDDGVQAEWVVTAIGEEGSYRDIAVRTTDREHYWLRNDNILRIVHRPAA